MLIKNNLRAQNTLVYHVGVPLALYRDDSSPAAGQKLKFDREDKNRGDSRSNNKSNPKVEIYDLLRKHFTNGIWKVNPYIRFRDLEIFYNVHTSALSKYYKVCNLGMFQQCSIPYCKKTHRKATDEEYKHIVNVLEKAINNPNQVQAVISG